MRCALIFAGLVLCPVLSSPVAAQDLAPSLGRERNVLRSCRAEVATFCPHVEGAPARSGRNAAICLKSVKSSLSAPCRRAVKALFP